MSHARIRRLFERRLTDYCTLKGFDISVENATLTPTAKKVFIKSHLLPADTFTDTLGGDHKAFIGLYQMGIAIPLQKGVGASDAIIQELQDLFPVYSLVEDVGSLDNFKVQVMSPITLLMGRSEESVYYIPVRFEYRADTK